MAGADSVERAGPKDYVDNRKEEEPKNERSARLTVDCCFGCGRSVSACELVVVFVLVVKREVGGEKEDSDEEEVKDERDIDLREEGMATAKVDCRRDGTV